VHFHTVATAVFTASAAAARRYTESLPIDHLILVRASGQCCIAAGSAACMALMVNGLVAGFTNRGVDTLAFEIDGHFFEGVGVIVEHGPPPGTRKDAEHANDRGIPQCNEDMPRKRLVSQRPGKDGHGFMP
jgi:hypothetical protein